MKRRIAGLLLASTAALLALGPIAQAIGLRALRGAQLDATDVDALFEAERRLSSIDALFPPGGLERDAGDLLNPLLALDDGSPRTGSRPWWAEDDVHDLVRIGQLRSLPGMSNDDHKAWRALEVPSAWLAAPERMPQGDLSILTELQAYDHWHPESSGAFAGYLAAPRPSSAIRAPIPHMVAFQTLAKLRLSAGLRDRDMLPALREVRHFARLIADGEALLPTSIAGAILSIERLGFEAAVERGLLAAGDWTPVAQADSLLARRTVGALTAVYLGWAPTGSADRLAAIGVPLYGRCAAASEALTMATLARALRPTPWPGEVDVAAPDPAVWRLLDAGDCRLPLERLQLANADWSREAWDPAGTGDGRFDPRRVPGWRNLPWVRQGAAAWLMSWPATAARDTWRNADDPHPRVGLAGAPFP